MGRKRILGEVKMNDPNAKLYRYKGFFEPYLFSSCYEVREEINKIHESIPGVEISKKVNRGYKKKGKRSAEFIFNILVNSNLENPDEITKMVKSRLEDNLKCRMEEIKLR